MARRRPAKGEGDFAFAGGRLPVAIHGVHHVFHPPVQMSAWPQGDRKSRIVFITRGLERAEVEETCSMLQDRALSE
jgi:G3E family GTPase